MLVKRIIYNEQTKIAQVLTDKTSFYITNSIKELANQYKITIEYED